MRAWQLGFSEAHINDGAIVTTTAGMDTSDLLEKFGAKAHVGADTEARPWEMVGGVGFEQKKKERAPLYIPPTTRNDLTAKSPEAITVAEEFNDRAVKVRSGMGWGVGVWLGEGARAARAFGAAAARAARERVPL